MIEYSKYLKQNKYLKIIMLFFILLITYYQIYNNLNYTQIILFFILFLLLITNEFLRSTNEKVIKKWYYYSLALSIILAAILNCLTPTLLIIGYYYFSKVNEIFYIKNKKKQLFLLLHCILYLIIVIVNNLEKVNLYKNLIHTGIAAFIYLSIVYMLYIYHSTHIEKEEAKKLNEKLKLSNIKLHEYSQKIEELSIARERERVAQEIHDSLGHSLTALIMHLEFAEKTFATNPKKAQEIVIKARVIAKSSTSELRKAVSTLKKERNIESLRNSINELIDNFSTLNDIQIDLIMDKGFETLNPDLKLCIYKTIRESLTNGIKHGSSRAFKIKLSIEKNIIILRIKDNGVGCNKITLSNGLKGIKERVIALGGFVDFNSQKNKGFLIEAKLPIY